jgi:hypothetical protein
MAAQLAQQDRWQDIYPPPTADGEVAQAKTWRELSAANGFGKLDVGPFSYHPYYISLARPIIGSFSVDAVRNGFRTLNRLSIVWVALELSLMVSWTGLASQLLITLMLAACSPVVSAVQFGQNTVIALALSMTALRLWSRREGTASLVGAAALAGLAWTCKPWCMLLPPICFAFRAPRTSAAVVAALSAAMMALPYAIYPDSMMTRDVAFAARLARTTVPGVLNLSLLISMERLNDPTLLSRLFDFGKIEPHAPLHYLSIGIAVLCAGAASIGAVRRRPPVAWVVAVSLSLMLLPLGVLWTHYFVFALPLMFLGLAADHGSRLLRGLSVGLFIEMMVLENWLVFEFGRASPWPLLLPVVSIALLSVLSMWLVSGSSGSVPGAVALDVDSVEELSLNVS